MRLERVELHWVRMPFREPYHTSLGSASEKDAIFVKICADGMIGWGESSPITFADITPEWCWDELRDFLMPEFMRRNTTRPDDFNGWALGFNVSRVALTGIEGALWDLCAQWENQSLARTLGCERMRIPVGLVVGVEENTAQLLRVVEDHLPHGYQRLKVKIRPGWDTEPLAAIRAHYPDLTVIADANGAYRMPEHLDQLRQLDAFHLQLLEQPLSKDDLSGCTQLQAALDTSIGLDEGVESVMDLETALTREACRAVAVRTQRVGGHQAAMELSDYCAGCGVPVYCSGVPQLGIGHCHELAQAGRAPYQWPADIAPTARWYEDDVIDPWLELDADGCLPVPDDLGLGCFVVEAKIAQYEVQHAVFKAGSGH